MNRAEALQAAQRDTFDICIIGGGITGAGILTDALQRGYKVLLLDKNDFASGTSSRSSKMIHGGLRYLKMFQLSMVREALHEREHLLRRYPHLVRPLPFILASYSSFGLNLNALGIRFYGALAGGSTLHKSQKLSPQKVLDYLPGFNEKNLKGGVLYWDGWTNDALLTVSVLQEAELNGATVLNYCKAEHFCHRAERIESLQCTDRLSGERFSVNARVFINAAGVWVDELLHDFRGQNQSVMKPSKGVHVVISNKRIASNYVALIASGAGDKRYLYSFPWEHNLTVLGNTDTDYQGDLNHLTATPEDVTYILASFNKSFPHAHLTTADICSVYTGLRSMLNEGKNKGSYSRSREYHIWWTGENLLTIAGGKLTSFLSMGKHCTEAMEKKFPAKKNTATSKWQSINPKEEQINALIRADKSLSETIFSDWSTTKAELIYHIRHSFSRQVEDLLTRRTALTYALKTFDEKGVRATAALMATELNEPEAWINEQVRKYHEHWREYHPDFLNS